MRYFNLLLRPTAKLFLISYLACSAMLTFVAPLASWAEFCMECGTTGVQTTGTQCSPACVPASSCTLVSMGACPLPVVTCGSANGTTVPVAPSGAALCSDGSSPPVLGTGPWTWQCLTHPCSAALAGGVSCSAPLLGSSICGTQDFVVNCQGAAPNCAMTCGSCPSGFTVNPPNSLTLTCMIGGTPHPNGIETCTCNAGPVNGACGSPNGTSVTSAPTTNLCGDGSSPTVSDSNGIANGPTGPWSWTCAGSGGGSAASCSASMVTGGGNCLSVICGNPSGCFSPAHQPNAGACAPSGRAPFNSLDSVLPDNLGVGVCCCYEKSFIFGNSGPNCP